MFIDSIVGNEFVKKVLPYINEAKHNIKIVVYDWRFYPNDPSNPVSLFNQAIIRAHRRGVSVECIANTDEALLILRENGILAKRPTTKKIIHAKMMTIDDEILIMGSHNYTQNAFTMNHEISIIVKGEQVVFAYNSFFNNLINIYV